MGELESIYERILVWRRTPEYVKGRILLRNYKGVEEDGSFIYHYTDGIWKLELG